MRWIRPKGDTLFRTSRGTQVAERSIHNAEALGSNPGRGFHVQAARCRLRMRLRDLGVTAYNNFQFRFVRSFRTVARCIRPHPLACSV